MLDALPDVVWELAVLHNPLGGVCVVDDGQLAASHAGRPIELAPEYIVFQRRERKELLLHIPLVVTKDKRTAREGEEVDVFWG